MNLCVFCGSSDGAQPEYLEAATQLGQTMAANGHGLVYGGASVGLMGAVADAVIAHGQTAIGVLPEGLAQRELAHAGLTELHIVDTMHERKAMMADLSDAFIVLPGGIGTLEEMFEVWTWGQLGIHNKPLGLLNVNHYYNGLTSFLDHVTSEGFMGSAQRRNLLHADNPDDLLEQLGKKLAR